MYYVGRVNLHSCPSLTLQESPERLTGCCQKQSSRTRAEESVGVSPADKSLLGSESSFLIESQGDSEYLPTPQKEFRRSLKPVEVPSRVCFANLSQLDKFVQQINQVRQCCTPVCDGNLVPMSIGMKGLGGAVSVSYTCNGCALKSVQFEASQKYMHGLYSSTEIG